MPERPSGSAVLVPGKDKQDRRNPAAPVQRSQTLRALTFPLLH